MAGAGIAFRARKHLRHDAERKLAEESRKFLRAFQEVDQVCLCFYYYSPLCENC
jgi:ribosomal protein L21E